MATFAKLTRWSSENDGAPIWVNLDRVRTMIGGEDWTQLSFGDDFLIVTEPPEEVAFAAYVEDPSRVKIGR